MLLKPIHEICLFALTSELMKFKLLKRNLAIFCIIDCYHLNATTMNFFLKLLFVRIIAFYIIIIVCR